jgi:amidohydrolase
LEVVFLHDRETFTTAAESIRDRIIGWRRDFHAHPELAYQEKRTAGMVAEALGSMGYDVETGIGVTGVVATLKGSSPGPRRGLRADMDALPIVEETGLPFRSQNEGVMHACCHDGHVAMLLGAAGIISEQKEFLKGEIVLIFQPAEEGYAGAQKMIDDGLFKKYPVDFLFGHHIMPVILPHDSITTRKGAFTASSDRFHFHIKGFGGHASMPHLTRDPVPALQSLVGGVNSITSRNTDPFDQAVISIGHIGAGSCYNAIPDSAFMSGSVRTLSEQSQQLIQKRMTQLANGIGEAHEVEISMEYKVNYPTLFNDENLTGKTIELSKFFWGEDKVIEKQNPFMGSEDFAFYSRSVPCCFLMIGAEGEYGVHHPKMTFDESILPKGAAWQAWLALESGEVGLLK